MSDDLPVTRRWLRSLGPDEVHLNHMDFFKEGPGTFFLRVKVYFRDKSEDHPSPAQVVIGDRFVLRHANRGQVRRLLQALLIPIKEPKRGRECRPKSGSRVPNNRPA